MLALTIAQNCGFATSARNFFSPEWHILCVGSGIAMESAGGAFTQGYKH